MASLPSCLTHRIIREVYYCLPGLPQLFNSFSLFLFFPLSLIFIQIHPIFKIKNRFERAGSSTKKIKEVNLIPQTELNYENLRTYTGFETITEEEAAIQIAEIKKMAKILFYLHVNEQNKLI